MKTINKYLYNIIFLISRIFSISFFSICLLAVLHAKYVLPKQYSYFLTTCISNLDTDSSFFINLFSNFCKNSQNIDLLLVALLLAIVIGILAINCFNKKYWYVYITTFVLYILMYLIFTLPTMLILAIVFPITLIIIEILNKRCPIQEVIVLIPIIGEIFCTKKIIQYMFKNNSNKITNFSLLLIALIVSNVICFLFPYKTEKDFENRIMDNWTYSIRPYEDKLIISGDEGFMIIDKDSNDYNIKNDICIEDFIINENKKSIYFCDYDKKKLLIADIKILNIINKFDICDVMKKSMPTRISCNENFSKFLIVYEFSNIHCLIDLNTYNIKYINKIPEMRDGLIYNKYRNCFLISFHKFHSFIEEFDIKNKKTRKIKAEKCQGYIAISERNKEIYVAFHQQGVIGVYDAETMKLKRKIKSNYAVKDITYDEELNVLIAPSYFTGYVDIFLMDGNDKLLTREFVGYELREGCFDFKKENLYVCSEKGLYRKKIDIKKLIEENSK